MMSENLFYRTLEENEEKSTESDKQQPVRQKENQKSEGSWKPNESSVSWRRDQLCQILPGSQGR